MAIKNEQLRTDEPGTAGLFVKALLNWDLHKNRRQMPWKGEKDPYRIWISEIILQQTRVEQGLKYYEKFIRSFPDIRSLATASEEKVFKVWEGLGYYSRCRNLIATARFIDQQFNGRFPSDHSSILKLKGVGEYTAAAIASFAFNLPFSVLDGNVFRVLSRVFAIETPVDSAAGKKQFASLAQSLLPPGQPATYNQAIMDFGATVCKPVPECDDCFFNKHCQAYLGGRQDVLPIKEKKNRIKNRWLNYIAILYKDEVAVRKREARDIWQDLFEFVLLETAKPCSINDLSLLIDKQYGFSDIQLINPVVLHQKLSHQHIQFTLFKVELSKKKHIEGFRWIKMSELKDYAFPKTLQHFIKTGLT